MTDKPVYLTYELKNGPSDPLRNYSFDVIIQDKCFTIEDYLFNSSDRSVRPDYIYTILKYNYKDSSIIVDVGISRDETGLHGDAIPGLPVKLQTPVPGGVGLLTRLSLIENLLKIFKGL